MIDPILSKQDLESLGIRFARQTLWDLERNGKFPARVELGARAHGWRQSEIAAWLESRPRRQLTPDPKSKRRDSTSADAHAAA